MSRGGDRLERKRAKALAPPTLRHRLEYVLVLGFSALARLGPVAWGYWLARLPKGWEAGAGVSPANGSSLEAAAS